MFKKISEPIRLCKAGSCCPILQVIEEDGIQWLQITDDFGGSIRIPSDKELLLETIEKTYRSIEK